MLELGMRTTTNSHQLVGASCLTRGLGVFTPGLARIYLNSPICQVTSLEYYRINELAATFTAISQPYVTRWSFKPAQNEASDSARPQDGLPSRHGYPPSGFLWFTPLVLVRCSQLSHDRLYAQY